MSSLLNTLSGITSPTASVTAVPGTGLSANKAATADKSKTMMAMAYSEDGGDCGGGESVGITCVVS